MDSDEEDWALEVDDPPAKQAVSIRLDQDVLDFFKADGKGYQTRINEVLRTYMNVKKRRDQTSED